MPSSAQRRGLKNRLGERQKRVDVNKKTTLSNFKKLLLDNDNITRFPFAQRIGSAPSCRLNNVFLSCNTLLDESS